MAIPMVSSGSLGSVRRNLVKSTYDRLATHTRAIWPTSLPGSHWTASFSIALPTRCEAPVQSANLDAAPVMWRATFTNAARMSPGSICRPPWSRKLAGFTRA